jgi:4-amino-4-deoxy-L-arabinose transferase-like glycosyltransferase
LATAEEAAVFARSQAQTPDRLPMRAALALAGIFTALTFLVHFESSLWGGHLGYGFFRDELYFLVCGHHLAWGYVDQAPMVALQARLAELLFGISPTGDRFFSFLATGVTVGLAGLLTWQFGGRRPAQILAMTCVMAAPVFLGTSNYLSMNAFEPCFWMGALFFVLRLADGSAKPRAWLLFGLLAGLGIENKHSTVFFLVALLVGLLLSPQRRILRSRACAAGVAVLILVALPNFMWEWVHHFPTYEFLNAVEHTNKNLQHTPLVFLFQQVQVLLYSTAPLWIGGLVWLGFSKQARAWRFVAITYLVFLAMMMTMHAKHYYLAPIYPVLFAAGAEGFAQLVRRPWAVKTYSVVLGLTLVFFTGPVTLTILPPSLYNVYTGPFAPDSVRMEKFTSPMPQILSDRFGWPQMVEGFAARYNALPPDVRAHTAIFCDNYGEASAVNILGRRFGLPTAISGHNNYFYWGWNGYTGESVLTLGDSRDEYTSDYAEVIDLGAFNAPWTMDYEHKHYFWLRGRKRRFAADWAKLRFWY